MIDKTVQTDVSRPSAKHKKRLLLAIFAMIGMVLSFLGLIIFWDIGDREPIQIIVIQQNYPEPASTLHVDYFDMRVYERDGKITDTFKTEKVFFGYFPILCVIGVGAIFGWLIGIRLTRSSYSCQNSTMP